MINYTGCQRTNGAFVKLTSSVCNLILQPYATTRVHWATTTWCYRRRLHSIRTASVPWFTDSIPGFEALLHTARPSELHRTRGEPPTAWSMYLYPLVLNPGTVFVSCLSETSPGCPSIRGLRFLDEDAGPDAVGNWPPHVSGIPSYEGFFEYELGESFFQAFQYGRYMDCAANVLRHCNTWGGLFAYAATPQRPESYKMRSIMFS
jgi:hypothetical protein